MLLRSHRDAYHVVEEHRVKEVTMHTVTYVELGLGLGLGLWLGLGLGLG